MSPHHPQLDPTTLAWLQLLQSQASVQDSPDLGSSSEAHANVQDHPGRSSTQPTHTPDDPASPDDENDSGAERAAMAEDKRRRNTAASGNLTLAAL